MSQAIFDDIVPSLTSGNELATLLNDFKDAIASGFSGTSRPTNLQAGGYWVDTTDDPNTWDFNIWTGTIDITVFTLNLTTGVATMASADTLFEIAKISEDSVGPILRMQKKRVTGSGQTLDGDTIGEVQFYGTRNTGAVASTARVRVIATDDMTASAAGSYMIFELAQDATASLVEMMRVVDKKIGVGGITPAETIHALGNIRADTEVDSTLQPKFIARKKRVSGSGQVLSGDGVGDFSARGTDNTGAEAEMFKIAVTAAQNITTTQHGCRVGFNFKRLGQTSFTEEFYWDDNGLNVARLNVTTLVALSSTLGTVVQAADAKWVLNVGGTQALANAAPAGIEIEMSDATHVQMVYDSTLASRWKCGDIGSLKEVVDASSTQNLSNKTLTTCSVVTPSRLDVKQDTESALTTYAATATNGQLCFATDTKVMYQVLDNALVALGSGGGGVSLQWSVNTGGPVNEFIDGIAFKSFDNISSQEIYAALKVPRSYQSGKQILLKDARFFCNTTTGKVFFKTIATLVNSGVVLGTYPNTRTSTNAEVTVPGVANTRASVGDLDLTSTTGQINGVSVVAGDTIIIKLFRDNASESSSASADARLMINAIEPTFS